jgi:beta-glucanase (GH16 family)
MILHMRLRPRVLPVFVLMVCFASSVQATNPTTQPTRPTQWRLVWSDEFNGPTLDRKKWSFDEGNYMVTGDKGTKVPGWGNNELEYYTHSPSNVFVKDGLLHIVALRGADGKMPFTSARITTKTSFKQTYGRFEFRARFPVGKGLWPALWLLPADNAYGSWAASGEIDVMENRGQRPNTIFGTIHFGSRWPNNVFLSTKYTFPVGESVADFHVYSTEWTPTEMRWFVDNHLYATQTHWWCCSKVDSLQRGLAPQGTKDLHPFPAPFDQPFYLLMNLSVGGRFVGPPDQTTEFPADMAVDYVRVYQRVDTVLAKAAPASKPMGRAMVTEVEDRHTAAN